jgi:hypothetical protein
MEFEWDTAKDKSNQDKHGISFEEIKEIFLYAMSVKIDTRFDYGETRYIGIGRNDKDNLFTVVFTYRDSKIRIISARSSNKKEKKIYVLSTQNS